MNDRHKVAKFVLLALSLIIHLISKLVLFVLEFIEV